MHGECVYERVERKLLTRPFVFFLVIFLAAMAVTVIRFVKGLGFVSNMSDGYPWGIWITYDVVVGTAFGCGGYALAILIYILNKKEFSPLIRSALLTSALGYTLAGFSVIVDLGRYWNMYGLMLPTRWNLSSVLLEVALCIMTYTLVLWIEFLPALAEKFGVDVRKMERGIMVAVVLGLILPTMHQSSLGSLHLISTVKLHPLWHSSFLPLLFLVSVVLMGYGMTAVESLLSSYSFKRPYETHLLKKLSPYMVYLGFGWLILRFLDLIFFGKAKYIFSDSFLSAMFFLEVALFLVPSVLFWSDRRNLTPRRIFIYALLYVLGGTLYRFNVYLIAWSPGENWVYFPSFMETLITLGIVSMEVLIYLVIVKKFPVLPATQGV